jgi:cell volume regulation protein A
LLARPIATLVATAFSPLRLSERMMLSWAGLRGAIPIWLATFPVIAGVEGSEFLFNVVFFVVVSSTLVQGVSFEPIAHRLGLTTNEPALPRPLVEAGIVQELGGDVLAYRVASDDAAAGRMVKELGLPRQALVNLIVRDGEALPPRGSTVIEAGDEVHLLIRREQRSMMTELTKRWREGPLGEPPLPSSAMRGSPQVFSVRPTTAGDGNTGAPKEVNGIAVVRVLRSRSDRSAAVVALADGRFAVTGPDLIAFGGKRILGDWCAARARREGVSPQDRAWWQEAVGALNAPGLR